jgi:hypothetical protein
MWNVKTRVIPVIIGARGTISKSFRKYVSTIPGSHEVKEIQKIAIFGTARILWKVLMYIRANAGASDMDTINSSDRIAGNILLLRDMVCLRNICVNTLHKGDSIFTNNNNNNNK